MGRRVESSPEIAKAFARALDTGSRLLSATAIATGAVGGAEIIRHSNALGLSVPVAIAAENDCLVSVKVEGNRGAVNEFTNSQDPTQKLTYQSNNQAVYLHPSRADTQALGRRASTWGLRVNGQLLSSVGYVCNTGLDNPNILQLGPKPRLIVPGESGDIVDTPDNCVVSVRVDGSKGPHSFTNDLNPSKNVNYRTDSWPFNLPSSRVDSRHNGRPASRWNFTLAGSKITSWEFLCNTGVENPNILRLGENGGVVVRVPEDKKISSVSKPTEIPPPTPKPEPTAEPTLTIPQVKATYDTHVAQEGARIAEAVRRTTEEEEKKKIQRDAQEKVRTMQANATATAIAYATAISQPTPKPPATPPTKLPTPTPILGPSPLERIVSDNSGTAKKLIDDTTAKIQEKSKEFVEALPKLTQAIEEFIKHSAVDGYSQIEPHLGKILRYSIVGTAALLLFKGRRRIFTWSKKVGNESFQKIKTELFEAKYEPKVRPHPSSSDTYHREPPKKTSEIHRYQTISRPGGHDDMQDILDLIFDAKGNSRLPKDSDLPKKEISGEVIAAVTRGEKVNGPLTGQEIDQYDLKELLGYGSYSSVYKAYDSVLRADRAIKILRPELHTDPALLNQFSYEARILNSLDHPNIVKLHNFGNGRQKYIVTEYIDGKPLQALYNEKRKPAPVKALDIISQIAQALDYAHSKGVSHNDLHPNNIVLSRDGQIKIIDFGSANHALWTELNSRHDATAQIYTAPEIIRGAKPSSKSDIYSFGVIGFQLITGERPSSSVAINRLKLTVALNVTGTNAAAETRELLLKTLSTSEGTRLASLRSLVENLQGAKI